MNALHKGSTVIETLVVGAIIIILLGSMFFGCLNKYIVGNKQFVDFKQTFRYAYVEMNGKTERIEIETWKDWKDSDAVQFVSKDGKVYYTHLNRVILSDK